MCHILNPLHVTSSLKNNFTFAILSIYTIQIIKYHYYTFSLSNLKFKFQNFSNHSFPPTFSLIPTNISFYILYLSSTPNPFFRFLILDPCSCSIYRTILCCCQKLLCICSLLKLAMYMFRCLIVETV